MLGLAQKLFLEKGWVLPKLAMSRRTSSHSWPLLDILLQRECLPYVDYALAEKIMPNATEEVAALLCHLSIALRAGHLCVRIDDQEVFPHPQDLWNEDNENPKQITDEEMERLCKLIVQGSTEIPSSLYTDVRAIEDEEVPSAPICRYRNLIYFQRYWCDESLFLHHFKNLIKTPPKIVLDDEILKQKIIALESEKKLLPEQSSAILTMSKSCLTIICGGPGTGKTYTAGQMIRTFWETITSEERQKCEIVLAAPTGRAASNLQKSLNQAVSSLSSFPNIQAKTLHALLGIRSSKSRRDLRDVLTADLVVIDESSMIDVHLISQLFASLKPGARLILLGDPHQLPPVSTGMLFSDLVSFLSEQQSEILISLKKCLRAELKTIVDLAEKINDGNVDTVNHLISVSEDGVSGTFFSDEESIQSLQQKLLNHATPFFTNAINREIDPHNLLDGFNKFRILSPLRQGPFGVDALNDIFIKNLLPHILKQGLFIAPIMLTQNDHRLELYNGEVGVLIRKVESDFQDGVRVGDYALFSGLEGNVRKVPALLLPKYEYAFCLSVHKSQGSEFDHVLLLLPEGAEVFGREMLYTAVTRARKRVEVWSNSKKTIDSIIKRPSQRLSGIKVRLRSSSRVL